MIWNIQLKTVLTFNNIIIEGTELSGGISLTLVVCVRYLRLILLTTSGKSRAWICKCCTRALDDL